MMKNTRIAVRQLWACLGLVAIALAGLAVALAADLTPGWLRLPDRGWWAYHRPCVVAVGLGFSVGFNLVGAASVAYALA